MAGDEMTIKTNTIKKSSIIKILAVLAIIIAVVVAITVIAVDTPTSNPQQDFPNAGPYSEAAASSDGTPCAQIAIHILQAGGNAADAAIAGSLCSGVVNPHSMGIGGGFLLTYYNRSEGRAYTLNARETAPQLATFDMYVDDPQLSLQGALAVAVPGEVRGYKALYDRFGGGVGWAQLFDESISLCEDGYLVHWHLADALDEHREDILNEPSLSMFINEDTGDVYQENDTIKLTQLGATLRVLQEEPDALYSGSLAPILLEDLGTFDNSIITEQDLLNYVPEWDDDPIRVYLNNGRYTLHTIEPPGSGAVLAFILNVLDGYNFNSSSLTPENQVLTYQRITETFKYGYAFRTHLGDHAFVDVEDILRNMTSEYYASLIREELLETSTSQDPAYYGAYTEVVNDHGTSHFSVLSANGDAVSVTGTINTVFGAKIASIQTGIIFNNEMDDFSTPNVTNYFGVPPSPANFIEPGKRPLSSMSPTIIVSSNGDVRLVVGAAGGTKITTATALLAMDNLWFGWDIQNATESRRIHHQLVPMELQYEQNFNQDVVDGLANIGHITTEFETGGSVISVVSREEDGLVYAAYDFRKHGQTDGY